MALMTTDDWSTMLKNQEAHRGVVAAAAAQIKPQFRCVLDRILLEEIAVEENRIHVPGMDLQRSERFTKKSDRGRVLSVGSGVPMGGVLMPMPYAVGMVVKSSEYGREYIYLKPADEFDKTIPKRYLQRVADTHGEVL